jgi:DUF2939 family protein
MARFLARHWTAVAIIGAILIWAVIYLPGSPSFAVFQLKRAIDARDDESAAQFVDFQSVVRHAGYEMLGDKGSGDPLSQFLGKGAVDLLSGPMAGLVASWARHEVATGAPEVQMPAGAVIAAMVLLHHDGDTAYTNFRDHKGQVWEIHLARGHDGRWQIVEVKNIRQLLAKLQPREAPPVQPPITN